MKVEGYQPTELSKQPDPPPRPYEWATPRMPDPVKAAALANAVRLHRRRIGDVPDPATVLATAHAFERYLTGSGEVSPDA